LISPVTDATRLAHTGSDPDWLVWAREIQAIAQAGLEYSPNGYDRERFQALRRLAVEIMSRHTGADLGLIEGLFAGETGYATPKVGVRGAVFDDQGRILMVREAVDGDLWTLPGGWADVNQTPRQSVIREIREESGYEAEVVKLAAVWDRASHAHPPSPFSVVRLFFICRLVGGAPRTSLETSGCGWFLEHEVPEDLSLRRTLRWHIARMFAHWRDPALPTEFD
jgi:ADP-ribose pyrophosphatase YjhB (NUDIX family)